MRTIDKSAVARRCLGALMSSALLGAAVVTYKVAPEEKAAAPAEQSRPAVTATKPQRPTQSATQPTTKPTTKGNVPGITAIGIHLIATPRVDGSFEVSETTIFAAPRSDVILSPPRPTDGGAPFAAATPVAEQVQLTAGGQPVAVGAAGRLTRTEQILLPAEVTRIELRYQLTGATVRSIPSVTGRALALLSPLTSVADQTLPAALTIRGPSVRNLICPLLPPAKRQCAPTTGQPGVLPRLVARNAVVIVQLDLPKPA
jgi:hypothetical protein